MELNKMTRKELEKLRDRVNAALKKAENRERRAARKAAQDAAQEFGFTLEELAKDTVKAKEKQKAKPGRKPGKAKYRNPDDRNQTWTGKGRRPAWYLAAIEAGKSPADLEI